jgi:hypothetical protein
MTTSTLIDATAFKEAFINEGFETGDFTGWSTVGMSYVDTSDFGTFPTQGIYSALLTTGAAEDGELDVVSDSEIESFLGLLSGSLDDLIVNNAIEGSAIAQIFSAKAGDILSFDWNFLTNEATPESEGFNDFAIVSINDQVFKLADTFSSFFSSSANEFDSETGFETFSYTIPTDGTFTLGFSVLDTNDTTMSSALAIDNVQLETLSVINGGFEIGDLTGWSTVGTSFVDTSEFGNFPSEGIFSALLITGAGENGELDVVSDSQIESFLGFSSGTLDNLIASDAIEGSAIQQTISAKAGDILSFDWNFLTNEATPESEGFNDFAFVSIDNTVFKLADTFSSFFTSSVNEFDSETGFENFSFSVTADRTFTLGFGVLDTGDTMMGSGLVVDNVRLERIADLSLPNTDFVSGTSVGAIG